MKRALLFDLDGTLTDPRDGITRSIRHALERIEAPVPAEQELLRWIGPPLQRSFGEHLGAQREALVAKAVSAYRERYAAVGMFENSVYPGVSAALAELKRRGWRLFVATSKPRIFAEQILAHFELSSYFSGVHGAELSGERSDKGELIAHLLETEDIAPSDATMIGDRSHDVLGARQNAVRALGVLWGYGDVSELVDAGAEAVFSSVPELVAALHDAG